MDVLPAYLSVSSPLTYLVLTEARRGRERSQNWNTDSSKPLDWFQDLNLDPLKEEGSF